MGTCTLVLCKSHVHAQQGQPFASVRLSVSIKLVAPRAHARSGVKQSVLSVSQSSVSRLSGGIN